VADKVAVSTRKRERPRLRPLLAIFAPERWIEYATRLDHQDELDQNAPLREAAPEIQLQHLESARQEAKTRLILLRRHMLVSTLSMGSAIAAALGVRAFYGGPMLPRTVFAVGSLFFFASATLGRLGWRGQSWGGGTAVERLDQRLFHVLYWIGTCWGTLAIF
jgi:hypothetical protein